MNLIIQRLRDAGVCAWLRFVRALNGIAIALLGGAVIVNQVYPGVIANAVSGLPPYFGIPLILAFGVLVDYALKRAKNAA